MSSDSETKRRFGNKRIYAAVTIVIIVVAVIAAWQIDSMRVNLPPMNLTLVGANGVEKILHASDMAQFSPVSGRAGFKTSVGSIRGVGNYTGVSLITLCNLVGGIGKSDSVQITGSDGYSIVFSYNQTNGNDFVTYDAATGGEVSNEGSFTLILAYHQNGTNISPDHGGPLRLVILEKEGLLTDGYYWVRWVAKIQVIQEVDWTLVLRDVSRVNSTRTFEYDVTRSYFEAGETCTSTRHSANWTDKNGNVWTGIPLWLLVGIVDNWEFNMSAGVFNDSLANSNGYEVMVISPGGSRSFNSTYVARNNNIIIANKLNGAVLPEQYWPLRLVGSAVSSDDMVVQITRIELIF
jgi:DMSO/TMAO reductase YedYZ molybdopterin-dependent catalytic subunit